MYEYDLGNLDKAEDDYYLKRLEQDFQKILKNRTIIQQIDDEPNFKNETESLKERLINIRECANQTSCARYLKDADPCVLLANLIMQVLEETADLEKLKPIVTEVNKDEDFFEVLATTKELKLGEALKGFEFFDNNPFKNKAERKLAKINAKKEKRMRR